MKQIMMVPTRILIWGKIYPNKGWKNRDSWIYADTSWHYACLSDLEEAQQISSTSVGFIKVGSIEKALHKIRHYSDVSRFDLAFFMSNAKGRPREFNIIGLWYPDRQEVVHQKAQLSLF